jgi:hypothetical protein
MITKRDLEVTKQTEKEGFTDFLARWRGKAAKMIERPSEAEQVEIFVKNLRDPYKKHLRYSGIESFARLNKIGIQIEDDAVETNAKSQYKGYYNKDKNSSVSSSKNEEAINALFAQKEDKPKRAFTDLGMSLSKALVRLTESGHLKPIGPTPDPMEKSPKWRESAYCNYHQGKGHETDNCFKLRHAIQDLIDNKSLLMPNAGSS